MFHELAKNKSTLTGEPEDTCATKLLQTLNLTLHRENARAILRSGHLLGEVKDHSVFVQLSDALNGQTDGSIAQLALSEALGPLCCVTCGGLLGCKHAVCR